MIHDKRLEVCSIETSEIREPIHLSNVLRRGEGSRLPAAGHKQA